MKVLGKATVLQRLASGLLATLICPSFCMADLIYEIGFDADSYTVSVGGFQNVDILFREIRDGASVAKLASGGDDGLFAVGLLLGYSTVAPSGSAGAALSSFTLNDAVNRFDPAFTTVDDMPVAKTFQLNTQARNIASGIEVASFVENGKDVFQVKIGTFSFQNNGTGTAATTLTLENTNVPLENLLADFSAPTISVYGTATISAVPEPSPLLMGVVAAFGLVGRRRRCA